MQPEISRRCPSCGAAIRERALFCPQCGKPRSRSVSTQPRVSEATRSPTAEAPGQTGTAPVREPHLEQADLKTQGPDSAEAGDPRSAQDNSDAASPPTAPMKAEPSSAKLKPAAKIRHASSAVIEEASYDPSLRFVLVALVLFVIFVVLLVLSKIMG